MTNLAKSPAWSTALGVQAVDGKSKSSTKPPTAVGVVSAGICALIDALYSSGKGQILFHRRKWFLIEALLLILVNILFLNKRNNI
jgi:hypothetical protein